MLHSEFAMVDESVLLFVQVLSGYLLSKVNLKFIKIIVLVVLNWRLVYFWTKPNFQLPST